MYSERVNLRTLLCYGYGSLAVYIAPMITSFFLNPFLLEVAKIQPAAAGSILLFGNIFDAFSDPLVGFLSDKTPWGPRRISWIAFATIPFVFFYIILWIVPGFSENGLVAYYTIIYISRTLALTCITVPYNSLSAEITQSYDERSRLVGSRWLFSLLLGTICVVVQSFLTEFFEEEDGDTNYEKGYAISGTVMAALMFTACLAIIFGVKEPPRMDSTWESKPTMNLFKGLKEIFKNVPFLYLTGMFTSAWVSLNLLTSNLFLYVKYVIEKEEYYTIMLFVLLGSCTVALPFWAYASKKFGKKTVYYLGAAELTVIIALIAVFPASVPFYIIIFVAAFAGIGLAVLYLIPYAMIPDVIEYDQLHTNERREGAYFSLYVFMEKFTLAIALALSGWILQLVGYLNPDEQQGEDEQPQSVLISLRVLVGLIPCILLGFSIICAWKYPITKKYHAEIVAQLQEREIMTPPIL